MGYFHKVQIFTNAELLPLHDLEIYEPNTRINSHCQHLAKIYRYLAVCVTQLRIMSVV